MSVKSRGDFMGTLFTPGSEDQAGHAVDEQTRSSTLTGKREVACSFSRCLMASDMLATMDTKTTEQRSENMRRVRRRDGKAELTLRRAIHRLGARYRVDDGGIFGRPDVCFRTAKVAVFVDSAFWHGRLSTARLAQMSGFWQEKLSRNRRRDTAVNRTLAGRGWLVIRVGERAAMRNTDEVADFVVQSVRARPQGGRVVRFKDCE